MAMQSNLIGMGRALIVVVAVVLLVYALFDIYAAPKDRVQFLPKYLWVAVVVFLVFVGPLLWVFFGQQRTKPSGPTRWSPPQPRGPDDDPDFLRGL